MMGIHLGTGNEFKDTLIRKKMLLHSRVARILHKGRERKLGLDKKELMFYNNHRTLCLIRFE